MPKFSLFLSNRFAALLRAPFPLQAAAACALFAAIGFAVLDDYGISTDEEQQRKITAENLKVFTLNAENVYEGLVLSDRYYGVSFELPLLLIERGFGLEDTREIYLTRHIITHLFFIAGGFFCALLVYRMFGSRWVAFLTMLIFLLHPRLYAHSFFNTKDIPFAAMLMIALWLIHRAFKREDALAFALCGVGVGLAINMRPFGLILPPMILAMRALDLWHAPAKPDRHRILANTAMFGVVMLATVIILHPYYWGFILNPYPLIEGFLLLSQHPNPAYNLFMGEVYTSEEVPPHYIPVWFVISAPTMALAMGAIGAAALLWRALRRWREIFANTELRFGLMVVACIALPLIAVIALQANIYNGWRQMFFLWTPFCLLAAGGVNVLARGGGRRAVALALALKLPRRIRGGAARRAVAYATVAVGLVTTIVAMAQLHPHQQVYFNALVSKDNLNRTYEMDYWNPAHRQALEYLLARYPDQELRILRDNEIARNLWILPQAERNRITLVGDPAFADFYIHQTYQAWAGVRNVVVRAREETLIHEVQAYGNAILILEAPRRVWGKALPGPEDYRAAYESLTANNQPAAQSFFDIYLADDALYYIREDCAFEDVYALFSLDIFPVDATDSPEESRDIDFLQRGGGFDDTCITQEPLPDYDIARIRTGQAFSANAWEAEFEASDGR